MRVSSQELKDAVIVLCKHLDESGVSPVEIPHSLYWSIPKEQEYDPYNDPIELTLGDLEEDWSHIKNIVNGKDDPVAYAFVWLAAVLRAVGQNAVC